MASARAWLLIASLAFLLIASVAEAQTSSPTMIPTISDPSKPHSPENQEEVVFFLGPSIEENNDSADLSDFVPDYHQDLVPV
ncbi:hypothetical protein IEQ34_023133 [Dendrobium chrysotoxum]|uniref:Uncharacterized protein n=1 Tax=Dendrobium chrysotoxum TaxID=161865 RepID=A0AAV7G106_DENCH|nr:hypothetical protein IEQ34_023133 [Dendrobium chrysotoxum]